MTPDEQHLLAQQILIAHQRRDDRSCLCGFDRLGACHARHQVQMLVEAGVLPAATPAPVNRGRRPR